MAEIGDGADAGTGKPLADIGREVEMGLARALVGDEKDGAFRFLGNETLDELGAHLIGVLRDGRPDRRGDAFGLRAELPHGLDRGLDDARKRAPPAGMRGADDPRASPSQNKTGAQSAVSTPMASPGVAVTMASASGGVSPFHGASAITASALCFWNTVSSRLGSAPSSSATRARFSATLAACVARARPAIERGIDAAGNAALAREESMAHAGERGEAGRAELHFVWCDHGSAQSEGSNVSEGRRRGKPASIAARAS